MACKRCRREAVERIQEMRRQRMVKGLCVYCGIDQQDPGHWGCRPCLDVKRAKRKLVGYKHTKRRKRRKSLLTTQPEGVE